MMKRRLKRIISVAENYQNKEEIILRDHLAMVRTKLANERTLFSYIRTSLYLILGGIAFLGMTNLEDIRYIGYFSLALSVILMITGIVRYHQLREHLKRMYEPIQPPPNTETTKEL